MTPFVPPSDEQSVPAATIAEPPAAFSSPQPSMAQSATAPDQGGAADASPSRSFYFEDEPFEPGTPFVAPFQLSNAMPTVVAPAQPSNQASAVSAPPPGKTRRTLRLSLPLIAMLVCVAVIGGLLIMNALAQTTPPMQAHHAGLPQTPQAQPGSTVTIPLPTATQGQGQGPASTPWVPQHVPPGWTQAGLSTGDALQALRTSSTFTDREVSLDYRSVGTRNHHGGTFTAATFLLTPAAQQRFVRNDVREINNTLFDMVARTRLIRLVLNPQPTLVHFAHQGQQQFAWVDVAFQFWQSQIDPQHPNRRVEGVELDPTTHQPRTHHMTVLLLSVPSQDAGANPAMGGTGWLVSTYGFDVPNDLDLALVQPA